MTQGGTRARAFMLLHMCRDVRTRGTKLRKRSVSLPLCSLAAFALYLGFTVVINNCLVRSGWMHSDALPPLTAVTAARLECLVEEGMFLGHQLPTFSANTALLDLTSCFRSPSLPLRTSSASLLSFSLYTSLCAASKCLPAAEGKLTVSFLAMALLLCVILFAY